MRRGFKRVPVLSSKLLDQIAGGEDEYAGDTGGGGGETYTYDDGSTYDASTNTSTEATDTGYYGGGDQSYTGGDQSYGGTQTYDDGSTYNASTGTATEATDTGYYGGGDQSYTGGDQGYGNGTQTYDDGSTYNAGTGVATPATDTGYFGGDQSLGNGTQTFDDGSTYNASTGVATPATDGAGAGWGTQTFDDGSTFNADTGVATPATDGDFGNGQQVVAQTRGLELGGDAGANPSFGDGVQRFDDGSSIQRFDDGSTLARDTDGNFTSSPATDTGSGDALATRSIAGIGDAPVDAGANAHTDIGAARAGLGGDGIQRFDDGSSIQRFDDGSTLVRDSDGNFSATHATDTGSHDALATRSIAGVGDTSHAGHTPVGGDGIQRFDDGSSIQRFDDGSTLVRDSDGNFSATPAPAEGPRNDGHFVNGVDLSQHNLSEQQLQTLRDLEAGRPVGDGELNSVPNTALAHLEAARNGGDLQLTAGDVPANLTPQDGGRTAAFDAAKRAAGIPTSLQPAEVGPNVDRQGQTQPGRAYHFDVPRPGGGTERVTIRDDAGGHTYPRDPSQNRGPHFNVERPGHPSNGQHYDYQPRANGSAGRGAPAESPLSAQPRGGDYSPEERVFSRRFSAPDGSQYGVNRTSGFDQYDSRGNVIRSGVPLNQVDPAIRNQVGNFGARNWQQIMFGRFPGARRE